MPGPTGRIHYATRGRGPGQWWPAMGGTATFHCPGCGAVHTLKEFKIDTAGVVAPSFVCSMHERDRCFHDSVVLVEWRAE
jgi:hypothetical protein